VQSALGASAPAADVERAHEFFIKYYGVHMLDKTTLYEGTREMLEQLKGMGHTLAVLTNKPSGFSTRMMQRLGLEPLFLRVYGGNSFGEQKKPDPVGILTLMTEAGVPAGQTWMVGDSSVDIRTARNAKVKACGVTWGFQPESFQAEPPDVLIDHPSQLLERTLGR
jgi:phosphoglycolate phosphatase